MKQVYTDEDGQGKYPWKATAGQRYTINFVRMCNKSGSVIFEQIFFSYKENVYWGNRFVGLKMPSISRSKKNVHSFRRFSILT